MKEFWWK